jgi:molybdopterin-guanine dinucleotide biosynthesis protein A
MNRAATTGIVLAGGKSTRLGRDKASELLLGVSLLQRAVSALQTVVSKIVVVKAVGQQLPAVESKIPLLVVEDAYPGTGPLGGIYTGLTAMTAEAGLVVACDMPLLQPDLLHGLRGFSPGSDAVVPVSDDAQPEPLCAVYARACVEPIRLRLEAGVFKVASFFDAVRVIYVESSTWRQWDAIGLSFLNVNREGDLDKARSLLDTDH